jgi:uncharacterized protein (DUF488 family)
MNGHPIVFTIGHSTRILNHIVEMLRENGITAVADVRSSPYSRQNPEFAQHALQLGLTEAGLAYVFLGRELGGRPTAANAYVDGQVSYEYLAATDLFRSGIDRVVSASQQRTLALMCSEKDPLQCHRALLIAPELESRGIEVRHVLESGSVESNDDAMTRLLAKLGESELRFFESREEVIARARKTQSKRVAFVDPSERASSVVRT